ncbi:MAG: hypothetical protein QOE31_2578, partial [Solirubrobacteraceae bacterium]|nr:hypothetical protein [Solirubrobacteraceae bacterium]
AQPSGLKSDTFYSMLVAVNGTTVTVQLNGSVAFTYTFAARMLNGEAVGLNKGFVGAGSDNSRGVWDNFAVQVLPPALTLDTTEDFDDGAAQQFTGDAGGAPWTVAGGRFGATAPAGAVAVRAVDLGVDSLLANSYLEVQATLRTSGIGAIAFDEYAANRFKFVALDVSGQQVQIGHVDQGRWVVDASVARALTANTDYAVSLVFKGTSVSVAVNGAFALSFAFNAPVVDGAVGVVSRSGATSFDSYRVRTNDPQFAATTPPPPPVPAVSIAGASVAEGAAGATKTVTLTLSLSAPAAGGETVAWTTSNGTATAGSDYTAASGSVTFVAGATSATISVTVLGDGAVEADETFSVTLSSPSSGLTLGTSSATVTITNDDAAPARSVSIAGASLAEGNSGSKTVTLTLTLSTAAAGGETVAWTTANGTATSGSDYTAASGTVTFAAGATSATITLTVLGDATVEADEAFSVTLSSPSSGLTLGTSSATVTITNDDAAPPPPPPLTVSVADVSITEGDKNTTLTLTVTLSRAATGAVTVAIATAAAGTGAGFATAGSDYTATSGTVTFAAGQTSATFTITIVGDRVAEGSEIFRVVLSSPTGGATIARGTATLTIVDNDARLMAATTGPGSAATISSADAQPALRRAISAWISSGADARRLAGVSIRVADLQGDQLAYVEGNVIVLDRDAAGWGWQIDPNAPVTAGRIDLLTVLAHELGHILGLGHTTHGVMADRLAPGVRLLPRAHRARRAATRRSAAAHARHRAHRGATKRARRA